MEIHENTTVVWPNKARETPNNMVMKTEETRVMEHPPTGPTTEKDSDLITAMWASVRYVLVGLAILAAIAAIVAGLYLLDRFVPQVWYTWARFITRDYTDVIPALLINWGSLIVAAWAFGVAYNLGNARYKTSLKFAILTLVIFIFGAIPTTCALVSATDGIPLNPSTPALYKAAAITVLLNFGAIVYGVIGGFIACVEIAGGRE